MQHVRVTMQSLALLFWAMLVMTPYFANCCQWHHYPILIFNKVRPKAGHESNRPMQHGAVNLQV